MVAVPEDAGQVRDTVTLAVGDAGRMGAFITTVLVVDMHVLSFDLRTLTVWLPMERPEKSRG
jgi:hypothetical protein